MKYGLLALVFVLGLGCGDTKEKEKDPVVLNNGNNSQNNVSQNNPSPDMGGDLEGEKDMRVSIDFGNAEDGPQIRDVAASPGRLSEGESVSVLAQVSDPQGFEDIGGGRVTDLDGTVYANFTGTGGSYQATLTWEQLNRFDPINFNSESTATFIAEFFDASDNVSKETFSVTLHCSGDTVCDGTCGAERCDGECMAELDSDENCGSCGNACDGNSYCNGTECQMVSYLRSCERNSDCAEASVCRGILFTSLCP